MILLPTETNHYFSINTLLTQKKQDIFAYPLFPCRYLPQFTNNTTLRTPITHKKHQKVQYLHPFFIYIEHNLNPVSDIIINFTSTLAIQIFEVF